MDKIIDRTLNYLIFNIGDDKFAIDAEAIVEVIEVDEIAKIPQTPLHMLGVVNFRGNIISIINVSQKLRLPEIQIKYPATIVIIESQQKKTSIHIGFVVDTVFDVIPIRQLDIDPVLSSVNENSQKYILGTKKINADYYKIINNSELFLIDNLLFEQ